MGTDFTVVIRAREYTDQFLVVHEFVNRIDERYRREGITVPYASTYGVHPDASEASGGP